MKAFYLFFLIIGTPLLALANPLPAEEVFQLSVKQADPNAFALDWQIKPGYFLYKNKIQMVEQPNSNFQIGKIQFPDTEVKTDAQGNSFLVYRNHLILPVSVLGKQPGEGLVNVLYQGCSDEGFCYPPMIQPIKLTVNPELALIDAVVENLPEEPTEALPAADEYSQVMTSQNMLMALLSFFGFGLLLAFTPCVLPMIPVLSGIIVGHGENITTKKAFWLSFSYVISMSLTYALVGAGVALLGSNLQMLMQSPVSISLFSGLFVILALSMFNLFELRLPLSFQAKLAQVTRSQAHGHYIGAILMGCLSTLILSPCVTPPLIGALSYIAQSGNVLMGTLALFFLGLGMGTPLLMMGTSAGKWLPKAGPWMNTVRAFFGVIMLAVAIYLLDRIIPNLYTMWLWASLLMISAVFMGALQVSQTKKEKLKQGIGLVIFVYGVLVLIGTSQGNTNPLLPLATKGKSHYANTEQVVSTLSELNNAIASAKGKPILLDFYADWCASCKQIAATTLKDIKVTSALDHFVILKVDLTPNNAESRAILQQFKVVAPPTFIFLDDNGHEIPGLRLVGEISSKQFLSQINKVLS